MVVGEVQLEAKLAPGSEEKVAEQMRESIKKSTAPVSEEAQRSYSDIGKKAFTAFAAAFGTRAIYNLGRQVFAAFKEASISSLQLTNAFETQRKLADANVAVFEDLADSLQKTTAAEDDATKAGIATLAQFKLTAEQLEELTPLMIDYARRTNQDVPAAAASLGKALLGQGRALKSIGIDFEDAGSRAANYEQLIQGLREAVGGYAEKEASTAAGKTAILANKFGEFQETLGGVVAVGLGPLIDGLGTIFDGFQDLSAPMQTTVAVLLSATVAAGGLALGAASLTSAIATLGIEVNLLGAAMKALPWVGAVYALKEVGDAAEGAAHKAAEGNGPWENLGKAYIAVTDILNPFSRQTREATPLQEALNAAAERGRGMMTDFQGAVGSVNEEMAESIRLSRELQSQQLQLAGGVVGLVEASREQATAERELASARSRLRELTKAGKEGTDSFREAQQRYREAVTGSQSATTNLAGQVLAYRQQMGDADLTQKEINASVRQFGREAGLTRPEIEKLLGRVKEIKANDNLRIRVEADTAAAEQRLRDLLALARQLATQNLGGNAPFSVTGDLPSGNGGGNKGGGSNRVTVKIGDRGITRMVQATTDETELELAGGFF